MNQVNQVIYDKLKEVARVRGTITYESIECLFSPKERCELDLTRELNDINRFEHQQDRPMMSALVVGPSSRKPGKGFWASAEILGKFHWGQDEESFWQDELRAVWSCWASH